MVTIGGPPTGPAEESAESAGRIAGQTKNKYQKYQVGQVLVFMLDGDLRKLSEHSHSGVPAESWFRLNAARTLFALSVACRGRRC
jgi:hypothetical protein